MQGVRRGLLGTGRALATLGRVLPGGHSPQQRGTQGLGTAQPRQTLPAGRAPGSAPACPQLRCLHRGSPARGVTATAPEGTRCGWWVPSAPRVRSSSKLVPLLLHPAGEPSLGDVGTRGQGLEVLGDLPTPRVGWGGLWRRAGTAPRSAGAKPTYRRDPARPAPPAGSPPTTCARAKAPSHPPAPSRGAAGGTVLPSVAGWAVRTGAVGSEQGEGGWARRRVHRGGMLRRGVPGQTLHPRDPRALGDPQHSAGCLLPAQPGVSWWHHVMLGTGPAPCAGGHSMWQSHSRGTRAHPTQDQAGSGEWGTCHHPAGTLVPTRV